jgi:DNA polymerase-3 subunit delta'
MARSLLCDRQAGAVCGQCAGCHLLSASVHPDYLETSVDEDSAQIKIDQIRALNDFMGLTRRSGRYKIALIVQADAMNRHAANSLLKLLEEPPPFSFIILITDRPAHLPPTILSRCQQIACKRPPRALAVAWLEHNAPDHDAELLLTIAHGAPLAALALSREGLLEARKAVSKDLVCLSNAQDSPVTVSQRWQQYTLDTMLGWLLSWLTDLVMLRFNDALNGLNNPDIDRDLRVLASRIDLDALFALYDVVLQRRRLRDGTFNRQLLLEEILTAWKTAFQGAR